MRDKYASFAELAKVKKVNQDFRVRVLQRSSATAIIAPHGGGIEPGTSEIAEEIAGEDLSFYTFEGLMPEGNRELHITSTRFDEPQCVSLVATTERVIAVHGEDSAEEIVFLGGLDEEMLKRLRVSLAKGFTVKTAPTAGLQGRDEGNICNRTKTRRGVQMELSRGLRLSFFSALSRKGRQTKLARLQGFVAAVREAVFQQPHSRS